MGQLAARVDAQQVRCRPARVDDPTVLRHDKPREPVIAPPWSIGLRSPATVAIYIQRRRLARETSLADHDARKQLAQPCFELGRRRIRVPPADSRHVLGEGLIRARNCCYGSHARLPPYVYFRPPPNSVPKTPRMMSWPMRDVAPLPPVRIALSIERCRARSWRACSVRHFRSAATCALRSRSA